MMIMLLCCLLPICLAQNFVVSIVAGDDPVGVFYPG